MSVDEAIEDFTDLAGDVFGHPRICSIRGPIFWPRPKYNERHLEDAVRNVVAKRLPRLKSHFGNHLFNSNENMCRTMVIAYGTNIGGMQNPHIFRSYQHPPSVPSNDFERNPGPADALNIGTYISPAFHGLMTNWSQRP